MTNPNQTPEQLYKEGLTLFNIAQATMNEETYVQAIELLEQSAVENNIDALLQLAYCYNTGDRVEFDEVEALSYYKKAADLGSAIGAYQYAYLQYGNFEEDAFDYLHKSLGDDKNGKTHYLLGLLFYHGLGCETDPIESYNTHKKSSALGNSDAMFELYTFYSQGIGVEVNLREVLAWNEKAASLNHFRACYNMGWYYETGTHVTQDINKAFMYYQKASDIGNGKATAYIGVMYEKGKFQDDTVKNKNGEWISALARNKAEEYYNQSEQQGFYELSDFLESFEIKL